MKIYAIYDRPETGAKLKRTRLFQAVIHVKMQVAFRGIKHLPGEQIWLMLYDGLGSTSLEDEVLQPIMSFYDVVVHEVIDSYPY
jgi:hypothetical protein